LKKAFTLIELIFVIVIIGLLASFALPKFQLTETSASKSYFKSTVSSLQSAIDNLHGEWIVNDNFTWNSECEFNTTTGYPHNLDDGSGSANLFKCMFRNPIKSCSSKFKSSGKYTNCFEETSDNVYKYFFSPSDYLQIEYNETNGKIECQNGSGSLTSEECEKILF